MNQRLYVVECVFTGAGVYELDTVSVCVYSLVLQGLELSVEFHIVPFVGLDHVVVHSSKGIDEVVTETWVNVGGEKLACSRTVLSPVSEITGEDVG